MDNARNAGIEGLVDITGTPAFGVFVVFWAENTAISSTNNTGQGDADLEATLALIESGRVLLRGKVKKELFPFPSALKNATGTVSFYLNKALAGGGAADTKMAATYRFDKVDFKYSDDKETAWELTIGAERVSALVASGFGGTQTLASAPAPGNKYLYQGRSKTYDPNTVGPIVDGSMQEINAWGISADTDAAEVTAIGTILAAYTTPPQTREKVYDVTAQRLSSGVVKFRLTWKQLDAKDAIQVPAHMGRVDPWGITSSLASAQVFALSSIPGTAALPSGMKLRHETDTQLNLYMAVRHREFAPNDSKTAIEIPGTHVHVDPNALTSYVGSAVYFRLASGTPTPASAITGLKLVETVNTGINPFVSVQQRRYGKVDSKDRIQLPGTSTRIDLSTIPVTTTGRKTLVFTTGSPPADPTPPTNTKIVGKSTVTLTGVSPSQSQVVYEFGPSTAQNRAEWGGTRTTDDPFNIADNAAVTVLSSGTTPSTPANPLSNLSFASVTKRQLTDTIFEHKFDFKPSTSADIVTQGGTYSTRSNFQTCVDVISTLQTCSANSTALGIAKDLIDGTVSTFFNTAGAGALFPLRLRVHKLNPKVARVVKTYSDPGTLVMETIMGDARDVLARMINVSTTPVVQVFIAQKRQVSSGLYQYLVSRTRVHAPVRLFTVRRMFQQAPPIPDQPSLINTLNTASFLGLAKGAAYYRGAKGSANIANSGIHVYTGNMPFYLDFLFSNDANGKFDISGVREGWMYATASLSIAAGGSWVDVTTITGSGITATVPAFTDFSVFLA